MLTAKLRERHRFPTMPPAPTQMHSHHYQLPYQSGTFVTINGPTLTHRYYPNYYSFHRCGNWGTGMWRNLPKYIVWHKWQSWDSNPSSSLSKVFEPLHSAANSKLKTVPRQTLCLSFFLKKINVSIKQSSRNIWLQIFNLSLTTDHDFPKPWLQPPFSLRALQGKCRAILNMV